MKHNKTNILVGKQESNSHTLTTLVINHSHCNLLNIRKY